jgi:ricin-type beta-trefoil lectin protein/lysozyme-like protein
VNRHFRPSRASVVLSVAALAAGLLTPAAATGEEQARRGSPPPAFSPGPDGLEVHLAGAALAAAARRCAVWATNAGFSNDGYDAGGLTIVVAIALAESGCTLAACFDNTRHRSCRPGSVRRADSVDRGPWQINSKAWPQVSNGCAFSGPCAAAAAYSLVSAVGTFFAPWTEYSLDNYAPFLWPAQQAVNRLRSGTVTSALAGSCLGYPHDSPGALARLENCGWRAAEVWRMVGSTLHTAAGLCLSAMSYRFAAAVGLARCRRHSPLQQWHSTRLAQLYNPASRRCLSDPSGGDTSGLELAAAACSASRRETWFRA